MLKLKGSHLVRPSLRRLLFVGPFAIAMLNYACSKASTSDTVASVTAVPTPGASNTATSAALNALASAYPGGLSLSLFPTDVGTSLRLADEPAADAEDAAAGPKESPKTKKEAAEKILNGKGDDCLPEALKKAPPSESSEACYEFDQDMIYGYVNADKKIGTKDGLNKSGEACLVAFSRSKVDQVADMVDRSTGMIQAMFCQAKKADVAIALPEKGKSLDLLASLTKAFGSKANSVSKASIKRLDDTEDGLELYESTVEMQTGDGKGRVVTLIHSPGADGDYRGIMLTSVEPDANDPNQEAIQYASIRYSRVTAEAKTTLNYELRSAHINKEYESVFGEDGQLDLNIGADFTGSSTSPNYGKFKKADGTYFTDNNKAVSATTFISASVDADTGAGTVLYAQNPGGAYNESARGLVANLAVDEADGVMKGCATSGAALGTSANPFSDGMSIRRSMKEDASLAPRGFFHPFLNNSVGGGGPNSCSGLISGVDTDGAFNQKTCTLPYGGQDPQVVKWFTPAISSILATTFVNEQNGPIITRQCFKLSDSKYVIDADLITSEAGYELVKTDDAASASKLIAPPNVGAVLDDKAPIGPPLDSIPVPAKAK